MPENKDKGLDRPPLEGVRVLDMTIALSGPFATLLLGGLGARVIKVEDPDGGDRCRNNAPYLSKEGAKLIRERDDDMSVSAINRLRNKLSVTLNLKHPRAREVFFDLVKESDVLVENFSRGTLDRLVGGYDAVRQINPGIIYCSINGFGSDSDSGCVKAMDTIIQALSGAMQVSGAPGEPPIRIGVPFADLITPLFGVIGVLAALHQSQRTGVGQHVDVSMLGAMTSLIAAEPFDVLERLGIPARTGQTAPRLAPFGIYQAKDGYVAICAPTDGFARALFNAMERSDLTSDPRFNSRDLRVQNVKELDQIVEDWTKSLPLSELLARLSESGTPAAEVREPQAAVRDPLVIRRGETVRLEHPKYGAVDDVYGTGLPIKFSAATVGYDQPAPELGEHNARVYGEILKYSLERIEELRAEGVI